MTHPFAYAGLTAVLLLAGACRSPESGGASLFPAPDGGLGLGGSPNASTPAEAVRQEESSGDARDRPVWHTFQLNGGVEFLSDFDTNVRLDSEALGRGTDLDLEDVFDYNTSEDSFRLDAYYRFNRHSRVNLSYLSIERSGSTPATTQDIQFGEVVIPAGSRATSTYETDIIKASYQYTLFPEEDWELGLSLGLYTAIFKTSLTASGLGLSDEFKAPIPIPVLGIHAAWEFLPRLRIVGSSELFYLKLDSVGTAQQLEGLLSDNLLTLEYDTFDHVGLGLGYEYFLMDFDVDQSDLSLSTKFDYQGLLLYLRVFF